MKPGASDVSARSAARSDASGCSTARRRYPAPVVRAGSRISWLSERQPGEVAERPRIEDGSAWAARSAMMSWSRKVRSGR